MLSEFQRWASTHTWVWGIIGVVVLLLGFCIMWCLLRCCCRRANHAADQTRRDQSRPLVGNAHTHEPNMAPMDSVFSIDPLQVPQGPWAPSQLPDPPMAPPVGVALTQTASHGQSPPHHGQPPAVARGHA